MQAKVTLSPSFYYQASTWSRHYRVVAKVEVSKKSTNLRFIVTDMKNAKAKMLYQRVYCARGAAELKSKSINSI